MQNPVTKDLPNYLRVHRKKIGLTQREVSILLGYIGEGAVSRHERFHGMPPLVTALAYEALFGIPVGDLFSGLRGVVAGGVEERIHNLQETLTRTGKKGRHSAVTDCKLEWISNWRATP